MQDLVLSRLPHIRWPTCLAEASRGGDQEKQAGEREHSGGQTLQPTYAEAMDESTSVPATGRTVPLAFGTGIGLAQQASLQAS